MEHKVIPVILSGGSGTRMWPLSRSQYPKQFLPLVSQKSLFQDTLSRLPDSIDTNNTIVICNQDHRFMAAEQLLELGIHADTILLEPVGRNTAPAVTLAALSASDPDDVLLVLPADHAIEDTTALADAIALAIGETDANKLVTFGIVPTSAATGYGYIRKSEQSNQVRKFVEKPDQETAESYIASGDYYWNSGMFAFKAGLYLQEIQKHRPDIYEACLLAQQNIRHDFDFARIGEEHFKACPADSIDYAVMEKTQQAVVIPLDAGWSDVGSWSSLWEVTDKDTANNSIKGDVLTHNTQNCLLRSEGRLLTAIGLKDIIVVETNDAVMVAAKDQVQDVKVISGQLQDMNRSEFNAHRKVYRPWGWYDSIDMGPRHQAKRISVNPGAKLSLQMHFHRAEHWVVIKGTARITLDDKIIVLTEDQSTYIPIGTKHRLENIGKIPLEIIEVQTGSYLGEDDIVRYSDDYGRGE